MLASHQRPPSDLDYLASCPEHMEEDDDTTRRLPPWVLLE